VSFDANNGLEKNPQSPSLNGDNLLIDATIAAENGLLENIQVLILILATLVFCARAYALYKKDQFTLLAYGLCVSTFPFIGAGRELSFGAVLGANAQTVLSIKIVAGCVVLAFLAAASFIFWRYVETKISVILRYLSHPTSLHIYLAIVVFGLSSVFEKGSLQLPKSEVLEELVELLAFAILARAAWVLR
jgi:hypothetical protein